MKVCDLPYCRVTAETIREGMENILSRIAEAKDADTILHAREEYLVLMLEYRTSAALAYMRYSINTANEYYVAENAYYDEIGPLVQHYSVRYASLLLDSPFRAELEEKLSPLLFKAMEVEKKSMSEAIITDMVEENKLVRSYSDLMSGMEFCFRGETMPRAMLMKYAKAGDRETRRECYEVLGHGLESHRQELDDIFDRLVHVRDRMAKKMGYRNFIELGYYRMGRLCYDEEKIRIFRENILQDVVPAVAALRRENAARMGIFDYKLYDDGIIIPGGDPKPVFADMFPAVNREDPQSTYTPYDESIFRAAREMYHTMGDETGAFIDMMLANEAFDVDARKNKWGGGYCTEFPKYRQPFILANFNGTAGDVDVVTHEAGHALNAWLIADNRFALELGCGGMETAETHSMSMEFFAWPYMEKFFGEDADKYRYMHALDAFSFLPYGTAVDAFQHLIYENPDMTPRERNETWLKLEAQFRPHISMEGMPYLEEGTRWQYQMHIYETPFYYIDHCLAQTAAFCFLLASREDYDDAFARYLRLSRQGGEKLWTALLEEAGFPSPFTPGALKELAGRVQILLKELQIS